MVALKCSGSSEKAFRKPSYCETGRRERMTVRSRTSSGEATSPMNANQSKGRPDTYVIRLPIESDDERFQACLVDSAQTKEARKTRFVSHSLSSNDGGKIGWGAYLSACMTSSPVIISVGTFFVSRSTTRIREVMEMRPPDK
jgi:hypothetical protein